MKTFSKKPNIDNLCIKKCRKMLKKGRKMDENKRVIENDFMKMFLLFHSKYLKLSHSLRS